MKQPNRHGSSNLLANSIIRGAEEAGHACTVIDAAHVNPCIGCIRCGYEGPCVQQDDMQAVRRVILDADMLAFVTPLYYGMSAQLKTLIDRFCSFNASIQNKHFESALISATWNYFGVGLDYFLDWQVYKPPIVLDKDEETVIVTLRGLNSTGQRKMFEYAMDLRGNPTYTKKTGIDIRKVYA